MIDVWCVLWGDKYHPAYVYALKEAVGEHLTVPHRFKCLTDHRLPGIQTVEPPQNWPGWWSKLNLFAAAVRPSLYFDLDVLIVRNIDYLVEYTVHELAAPANWAQSGHGGIQSSVMAWDGTWRDPFERFDYAVDSKRLWGDQEYLWELRGDDWTRIPGVASFKYHCIAQLQDWAHVVAFHGLPKPPEAGSWTWPFTRTLRSIISDSMLNGFDAALANAGIASGSLPTGTPRQTSTSSVAPGTPRAAGSDTRASS